MVAAKQARPPARPLDNPEDVWSEGVRREGVVRSLVVAGINSRAAVKAAAGALGLQPGPGLSTDCHVSRKSGHRVARSDEAWADEGRPPAAVRRRATDRAGHQRHLHEPRAANDGQAAARSAQAIARLRVSTPPSRTAIQAFRVSARSLREMVKAREGSPAARQRFVLPVRPGLRPRSALDIVQIDHTKVDIQLVDDRKCSAVLGRPWLHTAARRILAIRSWLLSLSLDPPSAAGVAQMAIAQGILPKSEWLTRNDLNLTWPMHGLPRSLHLDNGAEFHSHALKRGCQQHGVRIDYRPPGRTPRFGGHIERLTGTLMARVHALPGTTSSNVIARGDYPSERKAVLTLRELERILALEILRAALTTKCIPRWPRRQQRRGPMASPLAETLACHAGPSCCFHPRFPALSAAHCAARRRAAFQRHLLRRHVGAAARQQRVAASSSGQILIPAI